MQIICTVDIRTRELSLEDVTIAAFDHLVDDILFDVEPIDGFQMDTSTIKIAAVGPLGEQHDYEIDPSTVTVDEETGNTNFIWSIPVGVTAMPLSSFKINDVKKITFAVCAEIVSGDNLVKAWHSNDGTIKVKAHLEPESGGGEDPSEEATNAQKIAALQRQVGAISSGAPPAAASTAGMNPDISTTYINTTDGHLYFWNGTDWDQGGIYGANIVDDTLTEDGVAADSGAVNRALAEKADADDVTAIDTRVIAVEDSVSDLFGSKSSNLFNRYDESSVTTQKYYTTTGEKASSSSWSTADIDVHQYDKVEYNGLSSEGGAAVVSCWLDENKGFLSYFKQHTGKNTIDVPTGAYYVGFSINRSQDVLNAFVVYGISNGRIDDIEAETGQNTADIATISAGISDYIKTVPFYFDSQLATKIPAIISNMNEAGSDGETFVFITDIHWETNYKNSPALVDYVLKHTKVQNVYCGGDLINEGDNSTMMATLIECIRTFQFPLADNFLPIARGNHDDNSNWSSAEDIASHEFDFNTVRSLVCSQVVNKVTFLTNTEHSFYFDHEQSKTRFVFIDTRRNGTVSNFPTTALDTLLLATPQDYKLVFIAHYLYASSFKSGAVMLMNMVSAFNGKTTGSYSGVNFDYTNTNGKAVCIIGGHTHFDIDWAKDDTTNGNISGVPIIITDTDSYRNHSGTKGTSDSQCFDVVTINYFANTIKCVRIGRGSDRTFTFD